MYQISFKIQPCERFPQGYSDSIECNYRTLKAAREDIAALRKDPESIGEDAIFKDASLWIVDEKDNIIEC